MPSESDDVARTIGLDRPQKHAKRAVLIAVLLGVCAIAGWAWFTADTRNPAHRYVTAEISRGGFEVTVSATGTVEPTNLVEVSSELSGTLATVEVDYNDMVEEGTVLATLDTAKLEAQLAVSRAALDAAIARVARARRVEALRAQLREGTLRFDWRRVAERMLDRIASSNKR